jgi:hypothetical protein
MHTCARDWSGAGGLVAGGGPSRGRFREARLGRNPRKARPCTRPVQGAPKDRKDCYSLSRAAGRRFLCTALPNI